MDQNNDCQMLEKLLDGYETENFPNHRFEYDLDGSSKESSSTNNDTSNTSREPGTYKIASWDCLFVNKSDNEEELMLFRVEALEQWWWKKYITFPIILILTIGIILPIMYYYPNVKAWVLYNKWTQISTRGSHMLITGYKNHQEIVEIYYRKSETEPEKVCSPYEEEKRVNCKQKYTF